MLYYTYLVPGLSNDACVQPVMSSFAVAESGNFSRASLEHNNAERASAGPLPNASPITISQLCICISLHVNHTTLLHAQMAVAGWLAG